MHGIINLDFNDVKTVLKDGGVALMSTGYGEGEDRMKNAIENALHSPLLNDNDVYNSKKILLSVSFSGGEDGKGNLMMEEMNAVNEFMDGFDEDIETKWGLSTDPELGDKVKVTILATGFGVRVEEGEMSITDKKEMSVTEMRKEQDRKNSENALINSYYHDPSNVEDRPPLNCFIFGSEDLDNDNLISAVQATPTYKRSRMQYNELVKQSKSETVADNTSQTKKAGPVLGTISFT